MKLALVAAMAKGRVIGFQGDMPWHMPADLAHFKRLTMGKPMIMGRRTFESIGRPLPGRQNIVVTRQPGWQAAGCDVADSIDAALALAGKAAEIIVMGGATLYEQCLPIADKLYLTFIDAECNGDTFFPVWDEAVWHCAAQERHAADEKNAHAYTFTTWQRRDV